MSIVVENLTNPGNPPVNGDRVKITHSNGSIEIKIYFDTPQVELPNPIISKVEFLDRFTLTELIHIEEAAVHTPAIRVLKQYLDSTSYVDLSIDSTSTFVDVLLTNGLIEADRKSQILSH